MRFLSSCLLAGALALGACATPDAADAPAPATASAPSPSVPASAATPAVAPNAPLPDASLYALDGAWTAATGEATTLRALRGQPVVLAMVFTHCGYACPMTVQDMKRIARDLPDGGRGVRFVLVSLDPERDTPEALRTFARTHALGDNWTLLTGSDDDVRMLAGLLGVRYRTEADGAIAHSNLLTLLDANGELLHQQEGLGADPAASITALTGALATS